MLQVKLTHFKTLQETCWFSLGSREKKIEKINISTLLQSNKKKKTAYFGTIWVQRKAKKKKKSKHVNI